MSVPIFSMIGNGSSAQVAGQPNTKYVMDLNNIQSMALTWTGGATSTAFTVPGITANSIVALSLVSAGTPQSIKSYVLTNNTITVTFSGDPGNVVVHAIVTLVPIPQTTT